MNTDFNPDRLRLPSSSNSTPVRPAARLPHHQRGSKFLKGPIPLPQRSLVEPCTSPWLFGSWLESSVPPRSLSPPRSYRHSA